MRSATGIDGVLLVDKAQGMTSHDVVAITRRALGTKVVVHANGKGAGRIVIPFGDLDEFQRLLQQITG